MKSSYSAPKLTVYGNVKQVTQATDNSVDTDFFIFSGNPVTSINGQPVGPTTGSSNITIPTG